MIVSNLKKFFSIFLIFSAAQSNASTLEAATIGAQVQVLMDQGTVSACGATLFGAENKTSGSVFVFNGSVMVGLNGLGMVKARISQVSANKLHSSNFNLGDLRSLAASDIWLKAKNTPATRPLQGVQKSPDAGYSIYSSDSTAQILNAILEEQVFQIGFQVTGQNKGNIMYGKASIRKDERDQLLQCLQELIAHMSKNESK